MNAKSFKQKGVNAKTKEEMLEESKAFGSKKDDFTFFKSIMCPFKEKCQDDQRPRWPTSSTKNNTQFGSNCPFAHHPMELTFPEQALIKDQALKNKIKKVEDSVDKLHDNKTWMPSGQYQDKNNLPQNVDPKKVKTLRDKIVKADPATKEDIESKKKFDEEMNLDDNFAKKFGLLKKACVLYSYDRYNDAFKTVAEAAVIV